MIFYVGDTSLDCLNCPAGIFVFTLENSIVNFFSIFLSIKEYSNELKSYISEKISHKHQTKEYFRVELKIQAGQSRQSRLVSPACFFREISTFESTMSIISHFFDSIFASFGELRDTPQQLIIDLSDAN